MVKKADFYAKVAEIEGKIPSISGLATNSALNAVENKMPDVSSLVKKKTDTSTKISDIENKIVNHSHALAADVFNARLAAQKDLMRKPEFYFKLKDISDRVTKNKTKDMLVENELKN